MSLLLDIPRSSLQSVLYYEKYIVISSGETDLKEKQLLSEDEYYEAREQWGESFSAMMGAEAIKILLENLDLEAISAELREQMISKGDKVDKRLLKRIEVVENFRDSEKPARMDDPFGHSPSSRPSSARWCSSTEEDLRQAILMTSTEE